jgi:hypothetical protein
VEILGVGRELESQGFEDVVDATCGQARVPFLVEHHEQRSTLANELDDGLLLLVVVWLGGRA